LTAVLTVGGDEQNAMGVQSQGNLPKRSIRWFHLTPDRIVIGLLVTECLLWLSERFQWFGFNFHKGWTVLVAVATVLVALGLMLVWFVVSLLFRWRFQFSIRSLLILTLAVAIPSSWLGLEMRQAKRQREAVQALEDVSGAVDWSGPAGPVLLRNLLGPDFFDHVVSVDLVCNPVSDDDVEPLKELCDLQKLRLGHTGVTDVGLDT